jgi:hypothetical protein
MSPGSFRACVFALQFPLSSHVLSWVQQFEAAHVPFSVFHVPAFSHGAVDGAHDAAACEDAVCHDSCRSATRCLQCGGNFSRQAASFHGLIYIQGIHFRRVVTFPLSILALGLPVNHVQVRLKGKQMVLSTNHT